MKKIIICMVLGTWMATLAGAGPDAITFQGQLKTVINPVTGELGPTNVVEQLMSVRLYDSPTSTDALWGRIHAALFDQGRFSLVLNNGGVSTFDRFENLREAVALATNGLYMEVFGIKPRVRISNAPFALTTDGPRQNFDVSEALTVDRNLVATNRTIVDGLAMAEGGVLITNSINTIIVGDGAVITDTHMTNGLVFAVNGIELRGKIPIENGGNLTVDNPAFNRSIEFNGGYSLGSYTMFEKGPFLFTSTGQNQVGSWTANRLCEVTFTYQYQFMQAVLADTAWLALNINAPIDRPIVCYDMGENKVQENNRLFIGGEVRDHRNGGDWNGNHYRSGTLKVILRKGDVVNWGGYSRKNNNNPDMESFRFLQARVTYIGGAL